MQSLYDIDRYWLYLIGCKFIWQFKKIIIQFYIFTIRIIGIQGIFAFISKYSSIRGDLFNIFRTFILKNDLSELIVR